MDGGQPAPGAETQASRAHVHGLTGFYAHRRALARQGGAEYSPWAVASRHLGTGARATQAHVQYMMDFNVGRILNITGLWRGGAALSTPLGQSPAGTWARCRRCSAAAPTGATALRLGRPSCRRRWGGASACTRCDLRCSWPLCVSTLHRTVRFSGILQLPASLTGAAEGAGGSDKGRQRRQLRGRIGRRHRAAPHTARHTAAVRYVLCQASLHILQAPIVRCMDAVKQLHCRMSSWRDVHPWCLQATSATNSCRPRQRGC